MSEPNHKAALAWALSGSTGLSAKALVCKAFGLSSDGSYPHDGGDFGRCERAMQMIPGLRAHLPSMAEVNGYWAALVPEWDRIAASEDQYALIQSIIRPKEDADPSIVRLGGGATMRFGSPAARPAMTEHVAGTIAAMERLTDADMDLSAVGTISTDRHPVVRYHIGHETGDVFGRDCDYDGPAISPADSKEGE